MRELFLLDPDVVYLNHGSFGACPRPVFAAYQRYQLELERQPVEFFARRYPELIDAARARLAEYVCADPAGLIFVPNASAGVNLVARSLRLEPGDEVLATDREYGGMDVLWRWVCERAGATYVRLPPDELAVAIGERTRVVYASHISSPTAEILPVEELCRLAREASALAIVDGAHAPGQLSLDVGALGADAYSGNCHKWLCAPKGAGFLWVAESLRDELEAPLVSWDWEGETEYAARRRWRGTHDPAACLAVVDAIEFQAEHGWEAVRASCHELAARAQRELAEVAGVPPPPGPYAQMSAAELPPCDPEAVYTELLERHRIEIVCKEWEGRPFLRVSFQGYNDDSDLERLLAAVLELDSLQLQ
ncbi:MAG: aminotransferase class V-fold PLP-dependent enzyme [Gaiellaceae bacterium]